MKMKDIDYNLDKTKDCILIDTNNWLQPENNLLSIYKIKGTSYNSRITKVLKSNVDSKKYGINLNEGDKVLLTGVVSDIAKCRSYSLGSNKKYYDVPVMQIIGTFNGPISLEALTPITDKIVLEEINVSASDYFYVKSNTTIGRVIKTGDRKFDKDWNKLPLDVHVGDVVLIQDNVCTKFTLDNKEYIATEESAIIGVFNNEELTLDNLKIINDWALLKPYMREMITETLVAPIIDYESLDWTDLFNRDLFQVAKLDNNLTKIKENDIILIDRNVTTYAYLGLEKFFITKGMSYIEGKVEGEEIRE